MLDILLGRHTRLDRHRLRCGDIQWPRGDPRVVDKGIRASEPAAEVIYTLVLRNAEDALLHSVYGNLFNAKAARFKFVNFCSGLKLCPKIGQTLDG